MSEMRIEEGATLLSWREWLTMCHIASDGHTYRNVSRWGFMEALIDDKARTEAGWHVYCQNLLERYTHGWAVLKDGVRIGMAYEDENEAWDAILTGTVRPMTMPKRIGDATPEPEWDQPTFPGRKSARRAGYDLRQGLYLKTEVVRKHYAPPPRKADSRAPFTLGDALGDALRGALGKEA